MTRQCRSCGQEKELQRGIFGWARGRWRPHCLECLGQRQRRWRAANPDRVREHNRATRSRRSADAKYRDNRRRRDREAYQRDPVFWRAKGRERYRKNPSIWVSNALRARYGITLDEYRTICELQNGVCAICGQPPRGKRRLCVDHDHKTRRVRGLLCHYCNRALGFLNDDPARLEKALAYLRMGTH